MTHFRANTSVALRSEFAASDGMNVTQFIRIALLRVSAMSQDPRRLHFSTQP